MSQETMQWLNENIMVGFGQHPWWADGGATTHDNLYEGPLERDEIKRKLLSWDAMEAQVFDADMNALNGYKMIYASDNKDVLGIHSDGYTIHQYSELLSASELPIGSAGLLRDRKVFWIQYEKAETESTPEGVTFRPHILISTSLDGSMSTQVNDSVTNTVCDNTMAVAKAQGERFTVKHTALSGTHWLTDAQEAVKRLERVADEFKDEVSTLVSTPVSRSQFDKWLDVAVPLPDRKRTKSGEFGGRAFTMASNKRDFMVDMYHTDQRVQPWEGTAFGVVQLVNTYANHHTIVKNVGRVERNMLRSVKGEWAQVDETTIKQLEKVL